MLPPELRSMVYRECFTGSQVGIVWVDRRTDPNNRYTEYKQICMPINKEFRLLLTCQKLYSEARSLYWSRTAVTCRSSTLRTLLSAIPTFARENIEVLKSVPPVDDLSPTDRIPLGQFLGQFPRLKYCELQRRTIRMYCHHYEVPPQGLLFKAGSDDFRDLALSLNEEELPVFVQRLYLMPEKDHGRVDWVYLNHTHARLFITTRGSISDEEGFRKVTGPVEEVDETSEAEETADSVSVHEANDVDEGYEADDEHDVQQDTHIHEGYEADDEHEESALEKVDN